MKRGEILAEDTKRYQQILEYISLGNHLEEEGEDPNAMGGDPNAAGGDPNAMDGDQNAMGGDQNSMGGDPNAMGGDPNAAGGDPNAMGGDPNSADGVEGFDPQMGGQETGDMGPVTTPPGTDPSQMGTDPAALGMEEPGPDDTVIDVDELTSAQDETNSIVQDIQTKFDKLLGVVDKFERFIEKNDSEIDSLKRELEKRNPTPLEKLDLRTVNDSYPFNVKPTEYWKDKEATSNYRVGGDTDEVPEQYDLHQSDVDDVANWKEIADSLDDSDLTDLTKIFNLNEWRESGLPKSYDAWRTRSPYDDPYDTTGKLITKDDFMDMFYSSVDEDFMNWLKDFDQAVYQKALQSEESGEENAMNVAIEELGWKEIAAEYFDMKPVNYYPCDLEPE